MKFTRFFAIAGLVGVAMLQPARASEPAASLQALLSDEDCEALPELLGDYADATIQKLDDCKYRLIIQNQDPTADRDAFDIRVGRLGGNLFFDATHQRLHPDGKEVLGRDLFWIPIHFIGRLEIEKDAVHFRLLDDDWLQDVAKTGRVDLMTYEEGHFLTAPREEVREFVTCFATDPNAFSFDVSFDRAPANDAPKMNLQ
jgi:hypothetical protein